MAAARPIDRRLDRLITIRETDRRAIEDLVAWREAQVAALTEALRKALSHGD